MKTGRDFSDVDQRAPIGERNDGTKKPERGYVLGKDKQGLHQRGIHDQSDF